MSSTPQLPLTISVNLVLCVPSPHLPSVSLKSKTERKNKIVSTFVLHTPILSWLLKFLSLSTSLSHSLSIPSHEIFPTIFIMFNSLPTHNADQSFFLHLSSPFSSHSLFPLHSQASWKSYHTGFLHIFTSQFIVKPLQLGFSQHFTGTLNKIKIISDLLVAESLGIFQLFT